MNFDFQLPSMFAFLVSHKNNLVIPLKICLNTKFHGPMLTDDSFSFTLQHYNTSHLKRLKYGINTYGFEDIFNSMTVLSKFHIILTNWLRETPRE